MMKMRTLGEGGGGFVSGSVEGGRERSCHAQVLGEEEAEEID